MKRVTNHLPDPRALELAGVEVGHRAEGRRAEANVCCRPRVEKTEDTVLPTEKTGLAPSASFGGTG